MNDFTSISGDDLDTLIEALEAWEHKDTAGEMLGDVMEAMITRGDPETKAKLKADGDERKRTRERERASRKERSIILRAKLLAIRNNRRIEVVAHHLTEQP